MGEKVDNNSNKPFRLYVGNLNNNTTQEKLASHFKKFGALVDCIIVKNHYTGSAKCGFIEYLDKSMMSLALRSFPHVVDGRTVVLRKAHPRKIYRSHPSEYPSSSMRFSSLKIEPHSESRRYRPY